MLDEDYHGPGIQTYMSLAQAINKRLGWHLISTVLLEMS